MVADYDVLGRMPMKKNVVCRVTTFCQSGDPNSHDEKCKCPRVFFHPVIRTLRSRSIFSRTRSNLFIAYYICRNSCQLRGTAEKYRFSCPSPISADLYVFILLLSTIDLRCLSSEVAFLRPQTRRYFQTSFRPARTQRTPTGSDT